MWPRKWLCVSLFVFCFTASPLSAEGACSMVFSSPIGAPVVFDLVYEDETLEVHETLLGFAFISPSVFRKIKYIDKVHVKNRVRLHQLQRVRAGEWKKVYVVLSDGREIHFFEHQQERLVANAKWK